VARLRNTCNFIFFISSIFFLVFNQNNLKEGSHLHKNEVLLICHERKKIYLSFTTLLFLYTSDFVLFLNKYLGFPCFKCLKYVTPFRASENEDRGPYMLDSSQFWKLESVIYIWWKFDALITFSTYHAMFVVYQAKYYTS